MLIITVHNDGTGTHLKANYTYEVRVNKHLIDDGSVRGHYRKNGWQSLMQDILIDSLTKGDKNG